MEGQQTFMDPEDFIPEVIKKRGWAGKATLDRYNAEQKKNAEYLAFAIQSFGLKRVDTSDPKAVQERLMWYFQRCMDNNMKPTVAGMAASLGVNRKVIWNWHNGLDRPDNYEIIESAYSTLEQLWEMYMMNGQINPVSGIFLGKNHFGYRDVQDFVVTPNNPLGETVDADVIAEKYDELPGE